MNFGDGIRFTEDSLVLSNVGLKVEKSPDSAYHAYYTRFSNGRTDGHAEELARKTGYSITQWDSVLFLEKGFSIHRGEKFRNQHVMVTVQVPMGKRIIIDKSVNRKLNHWFSLGSGSNRWRDWDWDNNDSYWINGDWNNDVEYIMTPGGIERLDRMDENELKKGKFKLKADENDVKSDAEGDTQQEENSNDGDNNDANKSDKNYRYRGGKDSIKTHKTDTVVKTSTTYTNEEVQDEDNDNSHRKSSSVLNASLYVFGRMFQQ
jgi:hypothetical protein